MTGQHIKKEKAVLFDIQRFSVNDGPGIRTNLFFKGCPLRCRWCHNPESYRKNKQLSFVASSCTGCMACVAACKRGVNRITEIEGRRMLEVDYSRCNACGDCIRVCCYDARSIVGKEYTVQELKAEVITDLEYYRIRDKSGEPGGVTLTGGEPMSQFSFLDRFLDELEGIHVCMETGGYAPTEQFERLADRVDLFLFDYKATNPERHKQLCGVEPELILKNLDVLCKKGADIILRLPLIPGVNDDEEHIKKITEIIQENPSIRYGEIMAYHNMGEAKAEQIGLQGERNHVMRYEGASATKEQKEEWLCRFHSYGLDTIKLG